MLIERKGKQIEVSEKAFRIVYAPQGFKEVQEKKKVPRKTTIEDVNEQ